MANQVYANGREISCKAADGKSIAAFPDVCFTPPQTPATPPGVPIPYPNTGVSSDTSDGSKNVKISGKEIMMKDSSPFSKTSGNEAGSAPKKGVITSKNTGKAFFNSWSMDVKVEGSNVVRHLDIMTHNHGSKPGNTPTWPYLDESAFSDAGTGPCKTLAHDVDAACGKHVKKTKAGKVKRKASIQAMCADDSCKAARKCVLSPHTPSNCCDNKTPHHVIPAHCFMEKGERQKKKPKLMPGCQGYSDKKAPCICVTGQDKRTGDHKEIHDIFDKLEDSNITNGNNERWSYAEAADAGAHSVAEVTKCDPACTKAQLNSYHQKSKGKPSISNNTKLRANSKGTAKPPKKSTTEDGFDT